VAAEVPTCEPTELIAGMTWRWDVSYPDFSAADGYELNYYLRGPEDLDIAWDEHVSAAGTGFEVRVPSADTDIAPGNYRLVGVVTLDGEDDPAFEGPVVVVPNPSAVVDGLSQDETVLAALDAAIAGRASDDQEEVRINGRMIRSIPLRELVQLQGIYRRRVAQASDATGEARTVEVVFGAPR